MKTTRLDVVGLSKPDIPTLRGFESASHHCARFRFLVNHHHTEEIMHSRVAAVLTLSLYLTFVVLGCSKPPESNPAESSDKSAAANKESGAEPMSAVVVPVGTVITVSLGQSVGSKISEPGQNFSATVASPVEVEGKTAIPSGASASGTIVDAKPLGRFKGGAVLQLKLTSININGSDRSVETSSLVRSAKGKGKRTAVMAGGGAGAGALIGGLARGGKGAAPRAPGCGGGR